MTTDIDNGSSTYPVLSPSGDGSDVTAAFTAAASRTNISTGEKLSAICGKIAKWFADLGDAAFRGVDSTVTASSTNLAESGAVKSALNTVDESIAIRVSGNKTTYASGAAIGQYVIVDGSTIAGITDGMYKAAKAIPYNTGIDSTYLTAVSGGGLNDLKSAIDATSFTIYKNSYWGRSLSVGANDFDELAVHAIDGYTPVGIIGIQLASVDRSKVGIVYFYIENSKINVSVNSQISGTCGVIVMTLYQKT